MGGVRETLMDPSIQMQKRGAQMMHDSLLYWIFEPAYSKKNYFCKIWYKV